MKFQAKSPPFHKLKFVEDWSRSLTYTLRKVHITPTLSKMENCGQYTASSPKRHHPVERTAASAWCSPSYVINWEQRRQVSCFFCSTLWTQGNIEDKLPSPCDCDWNLRVTLSIPTQLNLILRWWKNSIVDCDIRLQYTNIIYTILISSILIIRL